MVVQSLCECETLSASPNGREFEAQDIWIMKTASTSELQPKLDFPVLIRTSDYCSCDRSKEYVVRQPLSSPRTCPFTTPSRVETAFAIHSSTRSKARTVDQTLKALDSNTTPSSMAPTVYTPCSVVVSSARFPVEAHLTHPRKDDRPES